MYTIQPSKNVANINIGYFHTSRTYRISKSKFEELSKINAILKWKEDEDNKKDLIRVKDSDSKNNNVFSKKEHANLKKIDYTLISTDSERSYTNVVNLLKSSKGNSKFLHVSENEWNEYVG